LLAHLGHDQGSLATAINDNFVPRCSRAARWLRAGDQITCFQPIVGG
jgi:sulfur carrier protein